MEYNGYKPGYIYVLGSGRYYKIGYADDVEQRMKTVGASTRPDDLTEPITLLFSFQTTSKMIAERTLHEFFKRYRVKGEWFELSDQHVGMLQGFTETSVDEFVIQLHGLPSDLTLYTRRDIEFARMYKLRYAVGNVDILPDDLEERIEEERARRGREQRIERYRKVLSGLLEYMSMEDMEWLYHATMRRGVADEPSEVV